MKKTNQLSSSIIRFLLETFLVVLLGVFVGGIQATNSLTVIRSESGISCANHIEKGTKIETVKKTVVSSTKDCVCNKDVYTQVSRKSLVMNTLTLSKITNNNLASKSTLPATPTVLTERAHSPPRSDNIVNTS
jgi:hypothetical protein